jgi:hypothetical protein
MIKGSGAPSIVRKNKSLPLTVLSHQAYNVSDGSLLNPGGGNVGAALKFLPHSDSPEVWEHGAVYCDNIRPEAWPDDSDHCDQL